MARKPAAKTGSVVYDKKNPLDFLKQLTRWMCASNRKTETLDYLLESNRKDNTVKEQNYQRDFVFKRILSYCYNKPHLSWYFNKYLNNLFDFSKINTIDLLNSVAIIMDFNGHNKNNVFFYLKSNDLKDDNRFKVKKIIKDYYVQTKNRHINDIELNHFYSLFTKGIITPSEIIEMDKELNGGETKLKLQDVELPQEEQHEEVFDRNTWVEQSKTRVLPQNIIDFCEELKNRKQQRPECQSCKLFKQQMVVLDTNMNNFGKVNFAFYALNPGNDEVVFNRPLIGRAGTLHREKMSYLPPDAKWLLCNVILCSTANEKEIGKNVKEITEVTNKCRDMVVSVMEKFPADFYVPMGNTSMSVFGINGSITSKSGEIVDIGGGNKCIPLIHPSAVLRARGSNSEKAYDLGFDTIYSQAEILCAQKQPKEVARPVVTTTTMNNKPTKTFNIPPEKLITEITEDLTLFDVTDLFGQQILMTFIDDNGIKKYLITEYKIPVYIKNSSWDNCDTITEEVDAISYMNGPERYNLLQAVRDNLSLMKKLSLKGAS